MPHGKGPDTWDAGQDLSAKNRSSNGKLGRIKLLIIPAVKYTKPEIVAAVQAYISHGGIALVIPESFIFDQYARQDNAVGDFGLHINGVTLPPVIGTGEKEQNYDQSFSQSILYGEVRKTVTTQKQDVFEHLDKPLSLHTDGLVQDVDPGPNEVLARFEDGKPALILARQGKGSLYYLAAPLEPEDYVPLLDLLAGKARLCRPGRGQNGRWQPCAGR